MNVKKTNPKFPLWLMLQLDRFSCEIFALLLAICSEFLKIFVPSQTFGKVSSIWVYCRRVFVSLLVVTPCGSSQTLQAVHPSPHCREDSSTCLSREVKLWSASLAFYCVFSLAFPSSGSVPAWCTAEGREGSRGEWTKVKARSWVFLCFSASQYSGDCNTCPAYFTRFPIKIKAGCCLVQS